MSFALLDSRCAGNRALHGGFEARVRLLFAADVESTAAKYADRFLTVESPRLAVIKSTKLGERGAVRAL